VDALFYPVVVLFEVFAALLCDLCVYTVPQILKVRTGIVES